MTALAALIAQRDIERLILDYAAWNDAGDWAALAALYVPEGRMSRPSAPDIFIEGVEAILSAFRARPPRAQRHICANIRVDLEADDRGGYARARATSQILLFTGANTAPLVGSYRDRLIREDQTWKFIERRGVLDFPPR